MPLVGTLSTMTLPDLLQWLGGAGKTGTLRVERDKISKYIRMRDGRIVGCSSDDPPQRLGQFLLSRRRITEDRLRDALAVQDRPDGGSPSLGRILVDMGALSPEALLEELALKAEEIIFSLFDWDHGTFRFEDKLLVEQEPFPLDLRVQDVMLRGMQRHDEMGQIREVFHDPLMILRYTCKPPDAEIFANEESRSMYAAIDGERSIAEIVMHVHGSSFLVQKFLHTLHEDGFVEICGVKRPEEPPSRAAVAQPPASAAETAAGDAMPELELALEFAGSNPRTNIPDPRLARVAVADHADPPPAVALHSRTSVVNASPGSRLGEARQLLARGEIEPALDILDELYSETPGDEGLRRLTTEAEAAFLDRAYRHAVPGAKVPFLVKELETLDSESLTPEESFLLSRIDGTWDVRSIIQVAPFREVEAVRTLKRMRELGMVDFRDPS